MNPRLSYDPAVEQAFDEGLHRNDADSCPSCEIGILKRNRRGYRCTSCHFEGHARDLILRGAGLSDVRGMTEADDMLPSFFRWGRK